MTMQQLMGRKILDGLAEWLEMEASHTDSVYLREKFTNWAVEVRAIQEATSRVEDEE